MCADGGETKSEENLTVILSLFCRVQCVVIKVNLCTIPPISSYAEIHIDDVFMSDIVC